MVKININTVLAQMNTKYPFILTAAVLVTSAFVISITSVHFQTAVADADRCTSRIIEGEPFRVCSTTSATNSKELHKQLSDECKTEKELGTVEKCSSSQTAFGEFDSFKSK
jgi:hypothetical protein